MLRKIKLISKLLLLQFTAKSQTVPFEQLFFTNPLKTDFDSILHEQVKAFFKKSASPGLIIGISENGKKRFYSYGFADVGHTKEFDAATIFEIGSITKTFTANLLLQCQADRIIDIQKPISYYLPDSIANDSVLSKIIIADIASHRSGLPRLPSNYDRIKEYSLMQPYAFYKKEHLYAFLKTMKNITPGKYEYSNLGFGLLGTILENKTGKSLESLLNKYIWQLLGMTNTYISSKETNTDSATGYFYGKPAAYWQFDCMAGCGAIKSNAEDILKYLDAHMISSQEKFSDAVKKAIDPRWPVGETMQIGYAWHTFENLKHRVFWHNGGTYGFSTFAAFEPTTKTSIVLTANSFNVNAPLDKLATDLLILLTGK
jgi:CubicO group peptidase (beta-lactamase class C family)